VDRFKVMFRNWRRQIWHDLEPRCSSFWQRRIKARFPKWRHTQTHL